VVVSARKAAHGAPSDRRGLTIRLPRKVFGPPLDREAIAGRVLVCCSGDPSADGLAELTMGMAARRSSPLQS